MLNKSINVDLARKIYHDSQRAVITDALDGESAEAVYRSLCTHKRWDLCSYGPYAAGAFSGTPAVDTVRDSAYQVVRETSTADEYSFRYYGYNLRKRENPGLNTFLDYISTNIDFSSFISEVTGDSTFNFISPQATYFDGGCFLRTHNDFHSVNGVQSRKIAFVFGFTKDWNADWGGTFHVLDGAGNIVYSQCPGFNTLTLFKVPTIHYVSPVALYATQRRYAISGWFINKPGSS